MVVRLVLALAFEPTLRPDNVQVLLYLIQAQQMANTQSWQIARQQQWQNQQLAATYAAARRFAALPALARHAWLMRHLTALRAGRITLAQLP